MNSSTLRIARHDGTASHIRTWRHQGTEAAQMPACLLIHGFGESSCSWDEYGAALSCFDTVYAVDLRGHGDSSWDSASQYDIDGFVDDVAYVLDELGLSDVAVVGHSLGGEIALQVAAARPDRVRAVVLVDFAPELNPVGLARICADLKANMRLFESREAFLDVLSEARPLLSREAAARVAQGALKEVAGAGFRLKVDGALAGFAPHDLQSPERRASAWANLRALSCPLLVLRGAMSGVLSREVAQRSASEAARGVMREVRAAGHAVMNDNPRDFLSTTRDFFETVR